MMGKFLILSTLSFLFLTACSQQSFQPKVVVGSMVSEPEDGIENTISSASPLQCEDKDRCVEAVSCEEYPDAEVCYSAPSHRDFSDGEPYTKVE